MIFVLFKTKLVDDHRKKSAKTNISKSAAKEAYMQQRMVQNALAEPIGSVRRCSGACLRQQVFLGGASRNKHPARSRTIFTRIDVACMTHRSLPAVPIRWPIKFFFFFFFILLSLQLLHVYSRSPRVKKKKKRTKSKTYVVDFFCISKRFFIWIEYEYRDIIYSLSFSCVLFDKHSFSQSRSAFRQASFVEELLVYLLSAQFFKCTDVAVACTVFSNASHYKTSSRCTHCSRPAMLSTISGPFTVVVLVSSLIYSLSHTHSFFCSLDIFLDC